MAKRRKVRKRSPKKNTRKRVSPKESLLTPKMKEMISKFLNEKLITDNVTVNYFLERYRVTRDEHLLILKNLQRLEADLDALQKRRIELQGSIGSYNEDLAYLLDDLDIGAKKPSPELKAVEPEKPEKAKDPKAPATAKPTKATPKRTKRPASKKR